MKLEIDTRELEDLGPVATIVLNYLKQKRFYNIPIMENELRISKPRLYRVLHDLEEKKYIKLHYTYSRYGRAAMSDIEIYK